MVKLIVIARCIPEDVYLRSSESPTHTQLTGEKKFPVVVREPEEWPIGRLAIEIKTRYENLYKRQFGQVKYLKDNDDDCDLDPELTVADLLVDEGKAARDGSDQKRIIKLIQEQGRAIRQGSVMPDLTPVHYQPQTRPPIPRFPGTDRRRTEDPQLDDRPTKRRRLDQIEEETNDIVNSIEPDALNGNRNDVDTVIEPKIESPELARTWIDTGPATRDELEILPEEPPHFRPWSRRCPHGSERRKEPGPEIRESSMIPQEERQQQSIEDRDHRPGQVVEESQRQPSIPHVHAPTTPANAGTSTHTSGGQVVSMLNSMKSQSPIIRPSASTSASKFRRPARNVYDYPESDIDDTQMSPRSRASRTRITPKTVQTPRSVSKTAGEPRLNNLPQPSLVQESPTARRGHDTDTMDVDGDKENQLPHLESPGQAPSSTKLLGLGLPSNGQIRDDEATPLRQTQSRESLNPDQISNLGSDETWSIHEDGTRRKKKVRQSRNQRRSNGDASTARSSSTASSSKDASNAEQPKSRGLKRKRVAPTKVNDVQSRSEISELDSPGIQLSETLRRSSPIAQQTRESASNLSESATKSSHASAPKDQAEQNQDVEMDDVERPPDSVSDSEEELQLTKAPKRPKTKSKLTKSAPAQDLRCFTCWSKQSLCNNEQPKCGTCTKNKKTCQFHDLTKEEAQKIKEERKADKESKLNQKSTTKKTKPKTQASRQASLNTDTKTGSNIQHEAKASETPQSQTRNVKSKPSTKQHEHHISEERVATSSGDESSETETEPGPLESSQTKVQESKRAKETASSPSGGVSRTKNSKADVRGKSSQENSNDVSARSAGDQEKQTKVDVATKKNAKDRSLESGTQASPELHGNNGIKAKSSDFSNDSQVFASVEAGRHDLPVTSKDTPSSVTENSTARGQSTETRVTSTGKVLPPGMTEEQYEALVGSRANLTDQQRKDQKMRIKENNKRAKSTPSLLHQSSTQELTERSRNDTPSVKSTQQVSSTQSISKNQSKPPPSTQTARTPAPARSNTPMSAPAAAPKSAPAKSTPDPPTTDPSSKTKLRLPPTAANKGAKIKSPNPPFQPHQPQSKSVVPAAVVSTTNTPLSLGASKSLKDVRKVLDQSRSGSGASTPQPGLTTAAAKIAGLKRGVGAQTSSKKVMSLSDEDEDDDDDDDDDESDGEQDEEVTTAKVGNTASRAVNGNGNAKGNVTVRRRPSSDSGSDSSSGTTETEDKSGSGSGSTTASGSGDDDDDHDDDDDE